MTETLQQASLTVTREDQARALSQHVDFLGQFVPARPLSQAAPRLGMAANLAHHYARKLAELGLLFEGGRVYDQLTAREFRHAHDLLPPATRTRTWQRVCGHSRSSS